MAWKFVFVAFGLALGGVAAHAVPTQEPHVAASSDVVAGRYLVVVAGCNDCHTEGYMANEGRIPETDWLAGSAIGWRGPWGTTYAPNLRLLVQDLTEDAWVAMLRVRAVRPPMPWANVNKMGEQDARAVYRYVVSLGPKGVPAPVAAAPDEEPQTSFILLVPQPSERLSVLAPAGAGADR